jgi:hypothetical protein
VILQRLCLGKELALSIDDSKAIPFSPARTDWSFETDWALFEGYADVLINMGTYPSKWAKGIRWPAWPYVKSYSCADAPRQAGQDPNRTCGLDGQSLHMIKFGLSQAMSSRPVCGLAITCPTAPWPALDRFSWRCASF